MCVGVGGSPIENLLNNDIQRSENLKSKLWCPQFFQKTNKKSLHIYEYLLKRRCSEYVVIFRSFFGRIEDTLNCFSRFSDLYMICILKVFSFKTINNRSYL